MRGEGWNDTALCLMCAPTPNLGDVAQYYNKNGIAHTWLLVCNKQAFLGTAGNVAFAKDNMPLTVSLRFEWCSLPTLGHTMVIKLAVVGHSPTHKLVGSPNRMVWEKGAGGDTWWLISY